MICKDVWVETRLLAGQTSALNQIAWVIGLWLRFPELIFYFDDTFQILLSLQHTLISSFTYLTNTWMINTITRPKIADERSVFELLYPIYMLQAVKILTKIFDNNLSTMMLYQDYLQRVLTVTYLIWKCTSQHVSLNIHQESHEQFRMIIDIQVLDPRIVT